MSRIGSLLVILALLFRAGDTSAAEVEVARAGSSFQIRARIQADAPVELCYAVLTDFDRLAEFVPGMLSSRVISPPGEALLLRQVGRTKLALAEYTFDVTLAVAVEPPRAITFRRVAGNLRQMAGSWRIAGDAARCRIDYQADIEPDLWVPPLVGSMLMRKQVARQVEGLESEIARRAQSAADR